MTTHVIFSGGLDSTALLAATLDEYPTEEVRAVTFTYGQRHSRETACAGTIAALYGIPLRVLDVRGIMSGGSLMGEGEIPFGEYAESNMASTVVHGRNLLFASLAIAQAAPGDRVVVGVHSGDHHIYPDCRPEFWEGLDALARAAYDVEVSSPARRLAKADLVALGARHGAPFELTWSCYVGGERHCGRCATCVERREAFVTAGVPDPTVYDTEQQG